MISKIPRESISFLCRQKFVNPITRSNFICASGAEKVCSSARHGQLSAFPLSRRQINNKETEGKEGAATH